MSYDKNSWIKGPKAYLGDGVYIGTGSYPLEVVLETSNGEEVTNRIVLDHMTWEALLLWAKRRDEFLEAQERKEHEDQT